MFDRDKTSSPTAYIARFPWKSYRDRVRSIEERGLAKAAADQINPFCRFGDSGRVLSELFKHALGEYQAWQNDISPGSTTAFSILLTLILSSRFQGNDWKREAVDMVSRLSSSESMRYDINASYLRLCAAQRRLDLRRRIPELCIPGFEGESSKETPKDPRSNACIGELLRSNAQDFVMEGSGNLDSALKQLAEFKSFRQTQSTMEKYEELEHLFLQAKIIHWQGRFAEAIETFYNILGPQTKELPMPDDFTRKVTCHLVASLCEDGKLDTAETTARIALEGLDEIDSCGYSRVKLKGYIDLQLSLIDVLICQILTLKPHSIPSRLDDRFMELNRIYTKLGERFSSNQAQQPVLGSKLSNLKFRLGRAFTTQLEGDLHAARSQWDEARRSAEECKEYVTDFIPMIIDYCYGHVHKQMCNNEIAEEFLQLASKRYQVIGVEHWWTGMGTYWLSWLLASTPLPGLTK